MENYLFGKKAIINALENDQTIQTIKTTKIIAEFSNYKKVKQEIVDKKFFHQFANINHQFCVAILKDNLRFIDVNQLVANAKTSAAITYVMLDNIEDPQNFGAIIRSCVAFGVNTIIFKNKNQAPVNDLVVKTSLGAVHSINLCMVSNINQVIEKLKKVGFWTYATTLSEKAVLLDEVSFDQKSIIILGNENKGISDLTQKICDFAIKIPLNDQIQSLNVSVACGIVLYQRWRKI